MNKQKQKDTKETRQKLKTMKERTNKNNEKQTERMNEQQIGCDKNKDNTKKKREKK